MGKGMNRKKVTSQLIYFLAADTGWQAMWRSGKGIFCSRTLLQEESEECVWWAVLSIVYHRGGSQLRVHILKTCWNEWEENHNQGHEYPLLWDNLQPFALPLKVQPFLLSGISNLILYSHTASEINAELYYLMNKTQTKMKAHKNPFYWLWSTPRTWA